MLNFRISFGIMIQIFMKTNYKHPLQKYTYIGDTDDIGVVTLILNV